MKDFSRFLRESDKAALDKDFVFDVIERIKKKGFLPPDSDENTLKVQNALETLVNQDFYNSEHYRAEDEEASEEFYEDWMKKPTEKIAKLVCDELRIK